MRPDQRWFPTNRVERAAWFQTFATHFAEVGLTLGFTQAEIDAVVADNEVVQFVARAVATSKTYTRTVEAFQQTILLGKNGSVTPEFPAVPMLNPPTSVPTGIFERLEKTVRRIRVQPAYTASTGALLGIIPRNLQRPALETHVPEFKVSETTEPYSFYIKVRKRQFKVFEVEFRRAGAGDWERGGTFVFTKEPVRIEIVPSEPGKPELVSVRVRMVEDNKAVGNYSNIQTVVLTP